jgi:hypothetical protein
LEAAAWTATRWHAAVATATATARVWVGAVPTARRARVLKPAPAEPDGAADDADVDAAF